MLKLVFYGDQSLPGAEKTDRELLSILGKPNPSIGYIPSSGETDYRLFRDRQAHYFQYGINMGVYFELDQRYYPEILPSLLACDAIHLAEGNPYAFLYWLRKRDLFSPLRQYAEQGGVLIGVGTGAMLMTPDISAAALFGENLEDANLDLTALRLVDFAFIPHREKAVGGMEAVKEYSLSHHLPVYCCGDGDGMAVNGDELVYLGGVVLIENGEVVSRTQG